MRDEMTGRERFRAVMNFEPFDRLPIIEWAGWWGDTLERWRSEGLPADLGGPDIYRHFGMDVHYQGWFGSRKEGCPSPSHHGAGIVEDMDDYKKNVRPYLFPPPVIDREVWGRWREEQKRGDVVLWFTLDGYFWFPRGLFGIEPHMYAFYDHPELMHRMNEDLADWQVKLVDELLSVCTPDFMTFAEDMSYNHGSMLSKAQFDEFMLPYYHKLIPRLKEAGVTTIVDSDGDITVPAAWFKAAGLDGILPLERQAGVDVAAIREAHPRMRFIGCFDKMTMNRGEAAMRTEFERLLPVARQGGLVISCDHQTPPGVSLDDYKVYLRLFREYAVEAGR